MKLIIAGTRTLEVSPEFIHGTIQHFNINFTEIVSGKALGIDRSGEKYANVYWKKIQVFEANWNTHGKAAGPIRNKEMANYSDALLLIWDGKSKGSASMKSEMQKLNKPIYEVILSKS